MKYFQYNEYQFQVLELVMQVWEEKMLQLNNWHQCYPVICDDDLPSRKCKITLSVGESLTAEEIEKFRHLCEQRFGKDSPIVQFKVTEFTNSETSITRKFFEWKENRAKWPHAPLWGSSIGLDYAWYLHALNKEWPSDLVRAFHIRCEGKLYRMVTDVKELMIASFDGISLSKFRDAEGCVFVPAEWEP